MKNVLDILLAGTARDLRNAPETAEYVHPRLSKEMGEDVVLKIKALTYSQVCNMRKSENMDLDVTLACLVEPNLKDERLAVHYGVLQAGEEWGRRGMMPKDLALAMFNPAELQDISMRAQRLSGFMTEGLREKDARSSMVEEITKK